MPTVESVFSRRVDRVVQEHDAEVAGRLALVAVDVVAEGDIERHGAQILAGYGFDQTSRAVVFVVIVDVAAAGVAVGEEADVYVFQDFGAPVGDVEHHTDEVVEAVFLPLITLLANVKTQRVVLGINLNRRGPVVGVLAREHLLGNRLEIFVDQAVQVVIETVHPIFVDQPVAVVVHGWRRLARTTAHAFGGAVNDVARIRLVGPELGRVRRCRYGGDARLEGADPQSGLEEVLDAAPRGPLGRRLLGERVGRAWARPEGAPVANVHL
jgi:hypothetical protein